MLKLRKQGLATLKHIRGFLGQSVAFKHMREHCLTVIIAIVVIIFMICWFTLLYLRTAFPENNFDAAYNWAWTVALRHFNEPTDLLL